MTYGIYEPGETFAHRLDPRAKIVFVLAYLVAAFVASGAVGFAAVTAAAVAALVLSGFDLRRVCASIRPFAGLMAFVFVFDALFTRRGEVLAELGPVCVSVGGIAFAAESVARFALVLLGTAPLMVTTSPTELSDGLALLLRPLARLGINVEPATLAVSMTLRFVPVVLEEFARVKDAQAARLADFDAKGLRERAAAYVPVMVPLFAGALRRARVLALAMQNRGYGQGAPGSRTCIRAYTLTSADKAVIAASCLLLLFSLA